MAGFKTVLVVLVAVGLTTAYAQDAAAEANKANVAVAKLKFQPPNPKTGDRVKAIVEYGATTVRAELTWFVNGQQVDTVDLDEITKESELEWTIKAGDKIRVSMIPFNEAGDPGKTVSKKIVCGNAGPEIKLVDQRLSGGRYEAQVEAIDPEGGKVILTLKKAPPGMKIDSGGKIAWDLKGKAKGSFPIQVSAKDDKGAETILSYSFTIRR
jgi:hypothetical protein